MRRAIQSSAVEVAALVTRISDRTGLDFSGCHRERMVSVLVGMSGEAGARSVDDYVAVLDRDPLAYDALVERLTIGETYFFRDPAQLEVVRKLVRGHSRCAGDARPVRMWSAGCATGEEPYTFAMILAEEGLLEGSSIVGTDLSERALERARAASYGRWSLRRCDVRQQALHFEAMGDRFRPRASYLDAVVLRQLSLLAGPPATAHFDVVCCRNVLMYLTREAQAVALRNLRDALAPGGWLFLGPSDSVVELEGLALRPTGAGLAYQRRAERAGAVVHPTPTPAHRRPAIRPPVGRDPIETVSEAEVPRPDERPQRDVRTEPEAGAAPDVATSGADAAADAAKSDASPEAVHPAADIAATVLALAGGADTEAAWHLLDSAIERDPVDGELRYLAAMLHLHAGRPEEAVRCGVAAVYLDPGLAVAHLVLGQAEQLSGNHMRARRSYLNALAVLSAMPPDAVVRHGAGEPAGRLAATAAALAGG